MFNITYIEPAVLYIVAGTQSVIYSGTTYTTNQEFRGVSGVTGFTFTGSGTQLVYEVLELFDSGVEFQTNSTDYPNFTDTTVISGFTVEFSLNLSEEIVPDMTEITGFDIELVAYPFYAFSIIETRW